MEHALGMREQAFHVGPSPFKTPKRGNIAPGAPVPLPTSKIRTKFGRRANDRNEGAKRQLQRPVHVS